jgi:hypothetical protein
MSSDSAQPEQQDEQHPSAPSASRKAFLVRLSPQLHDELRGWAAQELRSLNGHIEYLLRKSLQERKSRGHKPG